MFRRFGLEGKLSDPPFLAVMGRTQVLLADFGVGADFLETSATGVTRITARERSYCRRVARLGSSVSFFRTSCPERTEGGQGNENPI